MASKKGGGGNFRGRFPSLGGGGGRNGGGDGNHPGRGVQEILKEGRKSYKEVLDQKLGTDKGVRNGDKTAKTFNHIEQPQKDKSKDEPEKEM